MAFREGLQEASVFSFILLRKSFSPIFVVYYSPQITPKLKVTDTQLDIKKERKKDYFQMLDARYSIKRCRNGNLKPMTDEHCVVCFDSLFKSHEPCVMHNENNCNGVFHFACLKRWFDTNLAQKCLNCIQPATIFVFMDPQERVPIYGTNAVIPEPLSKYRTLAPSDTDVWVDDTGRHVLTNVGFSAKYALHILDFLLSGSEDEGFITVTEYRSKEDDIWKSCRVGMLLMDEYEDDVRVEVMVQHNKSGRVLILAQVYNDDIEVKVKGYFKGKRLGVDFINGQSRKLINGTI